MDPCDLRPVAGRTLVSAVGDDHVRRAALRGRVFYHRRMHRDCKCDRAGEALACRITFDRDHREYRMRRVVVRPTASCRSIPAPQFTSTVIISSRNTVPAIPMIPQARATRGGSIRASATRGTPRWSLIIARGDTPSDSPWLFNL